MIRFFIIQQLAINQVDNFQDNFVKLLLWCRCRWVENHAEKEEFNKKAKKILQIMRAYL